MQRMEVQDDDMMGRPYLGDLSSLEGYSANPDPIGIYDEHLVRFTVTVDTDAINTFGTAESCNGSGVSTVFDISPRP